MKHMRIMVVLIGFVAAVVAAVWVSRVSRETRLRGVLNYRLPEETRSLLERSDQFLLISLDPLDPSSQRVCGVAG